MAGPGRVLSVARHKMAYPLVEIAEEGVVLGVCGAGEWFESLVAAGGARK